MGIPIRKKWGQNFLTDRNIVTKIISAFNHDKTDNVLEIGPGKGELTFPLANQVNHITAVEIDPILISFLSEKIQDNVTLECNDILNFDPIVMELNYKIIGNLPYYITTPIIFKFLENKNWSQMTIMVQKEVADRITANPGKKIYGRLSVMIQARSQIQKHFNIPATAFYPKPKVDSTLLSLTPIDLRIKNLNLFKNIVKTAFQQRRKMIKNSLSAYLTEDQIKEYGNLRPEQLTVNDFINISEYCFNTIK